MLESDREAQALEAFLLAREDLPLPSGGIVWVLRAVEGGYFSRLAPKESIRVQQSDRTLAAPFIEQGMDPLWHPDASCHSAVVFATKHREEVLYHLALAVEHLKEGGILLVTAANDLGAGSLEKRVRELLGGCEAFSKHKCRVLYAVKRKATLDAERFLRWKSGGEMQRSEPSGLLGAPGMFSWKKPDEGSKLLSDFIPQGLEGHGADFGAGNGYLARNLLLRNPEIRALELLELEKKALDAAEMNLAEFREKGRQIGFHWVDITQGTGLTGLDFIVMNPPFHAERGNLPLLGQRFITEALRALRPGGKLFLVANRHLPYEAVLADAGGTLVRREEACGFKLFEIVKS